MAAPTYEELWAYGATGVRQTRHYPLDLVDESRLPNVSLNKTTREATLNAGARLTGLDLTGWGLSIKGAGVYVGGCIWDARRVDLVPLYPVRLFEGAHDLTIEDITYIGRAGLDSCETFILSTSTTPCDRVVVRRLRGSHFTADAFKIGNFGVGCLFEEIFVDGWSAYTSNVTTWSSGLTVSVGDHIKYVDSDDKERTYESTFNGTAVEPSGLPEDNNGYIYRGIYKHHDTFQGTPGELTVRRSYFNVRDLLGNGALALNRHWQTGGGLGGGKTRFEESTFLSEQIPLYNFAPGGSEVEFINNVINPSGAKQLYPQATDAEWERITWNGNKRSTDGTLIPVQNTLMQTSDGASEVTGDPVALQGFSADQSEDFASGTFVLSGLATDGAAEQALLFAVSCDVGDHRDTLIDGVEVNPVVKYAHSGNTGTDTVDSSIYKTVPSATAQELVFSGGVYPRSPKGAAVMFSVSASDPNRLVTKKIEGTSGGTSLSGTVDVQEGDLIVAVLASETPDGLAGLAWNGLDAEGGPVAVGGDFGYAVATKAITADNSALPVSVTVDSALNLPLLTLAVVRPPV